MTRAFRMARLNLTGIAWATGASASLVSTASALLMISSDSKTLPIEPALIGTSMLAGLALLIIGLKTRRRCVNSQTSKILVFRIYRLLRWLILIILKSTWFVITVAFFAWIGRSPKRKPDSQQSSVDDIWDSHPKHYYDKEPPKPFS